MRRSYPTKGCLLMVRAPKCSRTVGAALFDSNIVSFRLDMSNVLRYYITKSLGVRKCKERLI
jgi:hypothetical protein